jgi:ribonuclease-3
VKNTEEFAQNLNLSFRSPKLLELALTHRSYLNESPGQANGHNERLEFLGDAVLELAVTRYLYDNFPDSPEGTLTARRSALVKGEHLSAVARRLGVGDYLRLSRGEEAGGGRQKDYLLANAIEAIIGAIYLDQGYTAAEQFVSDHILVDLQAIIDQKLYIDSKSLFQELAQEKRGITPSYQTLRAEGPDHDKNFTMGAYLDTDLIAEGSGSSKQAAAQDAAKNALTKLNWE